MGTPLLESGSMNERSTPVCEKENGPSSFRHIQRGPGSTSCGMFAAGQTIERSSAGGGVVGEEAPPAPPRNAGAGGENPTAGKAGGRREMYRWRAGAASSVLP